MQTSRMGRSRFGARSASSVRRTIEPSSNQDEHTMPWPMRSFRSPSGRALGVIGLLSWAIGCTPAPGPTFPGHPMLTTYTKELAFEGSAIAYGDGQRTTGLGAAVSAFYRPWLSFVGGATFAIAKRKHYDTRATVR